MSWASSRGRFEYSTEAMDEIERLNCSKGCIFGSNPFNADEPGGFCGVLSDVLQGAGNEVVEVTELRDPEPHLVCTKFQAAPTGWLEP